jgi:hypothetical protein
MEKLAMHRDDCILAGRPAQDGLGFPHPGRFATRLLSAASFLILTLLGVSSYAQGDLTNGGVHSGEIAVEGEIDEWSFDASAGDSLVIRIGDLVDPSTYFSPSIRLVAPDGTEVGMASGAVVSEIAHVATQTGRFNVFVRGGAPYPTYTGTYRLHLVRTGAPLTVSADDEGGALTNGAVHEGAIHLGDLDAWTFEAQSGDSLVLRMGDFVDESTYFAP